MSIQPESSSPETPPHTPEDRFNERIERAYALWRKTNEMALAIRDAEINAANMELARELAERDEAQP